VLQAGKMDRFSYVKQEKRRDMARNDAVTRPCYRASRGFTHQDPTRHNPLHTAPTLGFDMRKKAQRQLSAFRSCMPKRSFLKVLFVAGLAMLLTWPGTLYAQGDARFSGTVLDQTGAFVPGATVTAKNQKTGEVRTVTTTAEGRYVVPNLKPSVYTISVTFGSFQPLEYTDMTLAAGQEFSLDLELHPAGVTETVTVEAHATAIDLSSARIGANVSEREVAALPVNGPSDVSAAAAGAGLPECRHRHVAGHSIQRPRGRTERDQVRRHRRLGDHRCLAGQRERREQHPFKLQASLENVQEFRVESSSYPAEYGTGTGGQVSVITKSGGNDFHGALFGYWRRDQFDSRNHFDSTRNPTTASSRSCRSRRSTKTSSAAQLVGPSRAVARSSSVATRAIASTRA
jgi:type 1 fimbria pilin